MRLSLLLLLLLGLWSCSTKLAANQLRAQTTELPTIPLEESAFNSDSINQLLDAIQATQHRDFRGLVVIKDNHLVLEEYYNTFWRNTVHDIRSAGKSVTALLLGIAMQEGLVQDLDQTVYSFFSKDKYPDINKGYRQVTLRHLLNMASGLDADSDRPETPGQAGQWMGRDEWTSYLLTIPLSEKPGTNWVYADINAVLVGAIIEELSGMSLRDYAQQKLFDPLGIAQVYWYTNAADQTGGAGNLYITTLDFAKLGLLVANEGRWNDQALIDPAFIETLVQSKDFEFEEGSSLADAYGMLWYKTSRTFGNNSVDYISALGNGGNQLIVVPDQEIVIALTSSAYGPLYGHGRSYTIMSMILTALE